MLNRKLFALLLSVLLAGCFGSGGSSDSPASRSKIINLVKAGTDVKAYSSPGTENTKVDAYADGGLSVTVDSLRLERGANNKITPSTGGDSIADFTAESTSVTFSYLNKVNENTKAKYYQIYENVAVKSTDNIGSTEPLSMYDGRITYYDVLALGGQKVRNGGLQYGDFGYWTREVIKEGSTPNGVPAGTIVFEHNNLLVYDAANAVGVSALTKPMDFRGGIIGTVSSESNSIYTAGMLYGDAYLHLNPTDPEIFAEFTNITKVQGGTSSAYYNFYLGDTNHLSGTGITVNADGSFSSNSKLTVDPGSSGLSAPGSVSDILFEGQFLGENASDTPSEVIGNLNVTLDSDKVKMSFGAN